MNAEMVKDLAIPTELKRKDKEIKEGFKAFEEKAKQIKTPENAIPR